LIKLIEDYQLQEYTLIAMGKQPDKKNNAAIETGATAIVPVGVIQAKPDEINLPVTETVNPAYPEGEFKINETKVVFVKKGTSFIAIAKKYDISLSRIFEFNEIQQSEETASDQLIYLQRKRKTGDNKFHIVQSGETLHDIAQQEAIRLESLMELNRLKEGMQPAIGEKLSLRNKSVTIPKLAIKENYPFTPTAKNTNTN
jgi:LysM repeat protein